MTPNQLVSTRSDIHAAAPADRPNLAERATELLLADTDSVIEWLAGECPYRGRVWIADPVAVLRHSDSPTQLLFALAFAPNASAAHRVLALDKLIERYIKDSPLHLAQIESELMGGV